MKAVLILSFLLASNFALAKDKSNRKPANSSWVECTAYSANDVKIEASGGNRDNVLKMNAVKVEVLSNGECESDVQCFIGRNMPIKFKTEEGTGVLNMNPGKEKLKDSWSRGDSSVYEISPIMELNGVKTKYFGACSRYN